MLWGILIRLFAGLAMIGLAIGLGCLVRRVHANWGTFGWGALCFVLSQVAHIPFNSLILNPFLAYMGWALDMSQATNGTGVSSGSSLVMTSLLLGLSAGLFEETTRWLFYRYKFKLGVVGDGGSVDGETNVSSSSSSNNKSYEFALMFGAGHGGCEAIIAGVLAVMTLIGMTYLRAHPEALDDVPADQKELIQKTLDEYWESSSALKILLGPVERIFAMSFHLSASVLVWQGFVAHSWQYWAAAVSFHTMLDAMAVFLLVSKGVYAVEICLFFTAFPLSLYILWYYHGASIAGYHTTAQDDLPLQPASEDRSLSTTAQENNGQKDGISGGESFQDES